jgi:hypothetical protein
MQFYYTNIFRWILSLSAALVCGISIYHLIILNQCKDNLEENERKTYSAWREVFVILLIISSLMLIFLCFGTFNIFTGRTNIINFYFLSGCLAFFTLVCEFILFFGGQQCSFSSINNWTRLVCSVIMFLITIIAYQINYNCDCTAPLANTNININPYTINPYTAFSNALPNNAFSIIR